MSTTDRPATTTAMFARVLGPFFAIVPVTVAVRGSHMRTQLREFEANPMWAWVLGAVLLLFGLVIICFHQYWRSAAAILVSLLGWFLAVRGLLLLTVPHLYDSAANALVGPLAYVFVRAGFIGLAVVGLYLTYVGWSGSAAPSRPEPAAVSAAEDRRNDRQGD